MRSIVPYLSFFFIVFLFGCDPDPITPNSAEVTKASSGQETALVPLEALDAAAPASLWEQFFTERGAAENWEMLLKSSGT